MKMPPLTPLAALELLNRPGGDFGEGFEMSGFQFRPVEGEPDSVEACPVELDDEVDFSEFEGFFVAGGENSVTAETEWVFV